MGNYFSITTHADVPPEVKVAIPPIEFTPANEEDYDTTTPHCNDCEEYFGWWVPPTNCVWCGARRCRRCAPLRHLLGNRPGCADCTQTAFRLRRSQMLRTHYDQVGIAQPVPAVPLPPALAKKSQTAQGFLVPEPKAVASSPCDTEDGECMTLEDGAPSSPAAP